MMDRNATITDFAPHAIRFTNRALAGRPVRHADPAFMAILSDPHAVPPGTGTAEGTGTDPEADARPRPLRALIVEDEAVIAMDIDMMLHELGVEVIGVAMTAKEAVRLATLHRPDFATMDINIKGDRDGVSAALEIYETLGIRAIFVSAYGNDTVRQRAVAANPLDWLGKPIYFSSLKAAIDQIRSPG